MQTASLFRINLGFVRAAVISPELRVADVAFNTQAIIAALREAAGQGCRLAVFPELCLTGYSCADLFYQRTLLEAAAAALDEIALEAQMVEIAVVVGLPLAVDGRLFNCAALIADGRVLGFVPKTYLPSTNEFYEERWFTSASLAIRRDGRDQRAGGAVRLRSAFCRRQSAGLQDRDRSVRGPVGGESAQRRHGVGRRDDPAQRLGQQRAVGEGGLPP